MYAIRGVQGNNVCWVRNYVHIHVENEVLGIDSQPEPDSRHIFYDFHTLARMIRAKNTDFGDEPTPWKWELIAVQPPTKFALTGVAL